MEYKLYTPIDITHTGQYRNEPGKEIARWQEQNFNTIIQTLGLRSNITYKHSPDEIVTSGKNVGLETSEAIKLWRFDFYTEQDHVFELDGDPVGYLKEMFNGVPYIAKLTEHLEQNYAVFVTDGPNRNIVFYVK